MTDSRVASDRAASSSVASSRAISWIREAALLPVLGVILVVGTLLNSHFMTVANMTGIGQQASALGVVVVG
jgi:simple sugar transport system permease protein